MANYPSDGSYSRPGSFGYGDTEPSANRYLPPLNSAPRGSSWGFDDHDEDEDTHDVGGLGRAAGRIATGGQGRHGRPYQNGPSR